LAQADYKGDHFFRTQGPGFAVALLTSVVLMGTIGFHLVEGWTLWHAFYVTVLGITTVDLPPLSPAGQAFSVLLLVAGVGAALYTFTLLVTVVVEGGLPKRLQRRRQERMLETIKDHFVICGYGRIGQIVAQQFRREGIPHLVVERDPERVHTAVEDGSLAENVYAVLSARVMRPDLFIVSRAETEDAGIKLKRAGADRVVSPYVIGAVQIAQTALRPAVVDFVELATSSESLELAMEEIAIAPASPLAGQSILDANLRQRYGVIVVGIQRLNGKMDFNPEPETVIRPSDKLVVLGRPGSLKHLEIEGGGLNG